MGNGWLYEASGSIPKVVQRLPKILRDWLEQNLFGPFFRRPVLKNGQQAGLTEEETVAIFGWTWRDYKLINPIAWGDDEVQVPEWLYRSHFHHHPNCTLYRADVWPEIEVLLSALNKLPPVQNVTLWRGSGLSANELGQVITGRFSSTSTNFYTALGFAASSLWVIESSTSGKDIADFSNFEEGEVLFPLGYRLEVVNCSLTTINATQQKIEDYISEVNATDIGWPADEVDAWAASMRALDIICMNEAPAASETMLV